MALMAEKYSTAALYARTNFHPRILWMQHFFFLA
jgi:hypothetical protein